MFFILILTIFSTINVQSQGGVSVGSGGISKSDLRASLGYNLFMNCDIKPICQTSEVSPFQLYNPTNSHVSTDGSYVNKVCCTSAQFNLRTTCSDPFIRILGVSDDVAGSTAGTFTNAHIEQGNLTNYPNSVCLSANNAGPSTKFECVYSKDECPYGYTCLASISNESNAHAALCNYYDINVCCKIELCSQDAIDNNEICIEGPVCRTNTTAANFHNTQNNAVCDDVTCTQQGCADCENQELCPLITCNNEDSYYVGCYDTNGDGIDDEYRDYFDVWSECTTNSNGEGECTAPICDNNYVVISTGSQLDRNQNNVPDLCDEDPCGQDTFIASSQLQSACFCDPGFSDCNGDINSIPAGNGCEIEDSTCPNVPICNLLPASPVLTQADSCSCPIADPLSTTVLSSQVCGEGQSCCYGGCVNGACDTLDTDYDDDGMTNLCEYTYGLNAYNPYDADHNDDADQLKNIEECAYGTNPFNPDTDADGLNDWEEVLPGTDTFTTNPLNPHTDMDFLGDYIESQVYTINPNNTDTDGDGLLDGDEISAIASWLGLTPEQIQAFVQNTNCDVSVGCISPEKSPDNKKNGPWDDNTDGDEFSDWEEVNLGQDNRVTNPFDPTNTCTWTCSEWSPETCEEGQTQTRTCNPDAGCSDAGKPSLSKLCPATLTPTGRGVPFFTGFNVIFTLFILISYYVYTNKRRN